MSVNDVNFQFTNIVVLPRFRYAECQKTGIGNPAGLEQYCKVFLLGSDEIVMSETKDTT